MGSSLHQWESDPLFSAAEVVQDSADRMESLFRLLLHEKSLVQGDHPDPRLLTSIEYHKRDLATILETAKWQLEDFERVVDSSAMVSKSQTREDVILRHRQFIGAIREQINHVEQSVKGPSIGDSMRNSEWVKLNDQDREVLTLFLTGGNPSEHSNHHDREDGSILSRFLDPSSASSLKEDEIVEHDSREFEKLKMNGDMHLDHDLDCVKEEDERNVVSHYSTRLGSDMTTPLQGISHNGNGDFHHLDLEANEPMHKGFFNENMLRGFHGRMNFFGSLNNLRTMLGNRVNRNYTKRLKDGEEERRHSPTYGDIPHSVQGQFIGVMLGSAHGNVQGLCSRFQPIILHIGSRLEARYQRLPCHAQVHQHSMKIILAVIFMLIFLGTLVSRIA